MLQDTTLLYTLGHLGLITLGLLTGVGLFFILLKISKMLTNVVKTIGLATFMGIFVASFTPMALEAYNDDSNPPTIEVKEITN